MKSIINGIRYDTRKALEIGEGSSGGSCTDFRWFEETLYRTPKSGRYFVAGRGGPMTRYAESVGPNQGWCGGSKIIPLSAEEALEWAEHHLTAAEIEEHFGDVIEDA